MAYARVVVKQYAPACGFEEGHVHYDAGYNPMAAPIPRVGEVFAYAGHPPGQRVVEVSHYYDDRGRLETITVWIKGA